MENIKRNHFYHVTYYLTGKTDIRGFKNNLRPGRYYTDKNGIQFRVERKAYFKYSFKDIENLVHLMDGYSRGSVQYRLKLKLLDTLNAETPKIKFTDEEREVLQYIYYSELDISDDEIVTLRKVLGLKGNEW